MALELTVENFQSNVLEAEQPVLVDFWSPTCGPCRRIAPVIDELAEENKGSATVGKVDVSVHQQLAIQYDIMQIPVLMIFKGGRPVQRFLGVQPKAKLQEALDSHK